MQVPLIVLSAALVLAPLDAGPRPQVTAKSVTLRQCGVEPVNEARVAAQEPGVLIEVIAVEGQPAAAGDLLARIDDTRAIMQRKVTQLELLVAEEEAKSEVSVKYAKATRDVAEAEYQQGVETNRLVAGTVPEAEMKRRWLSVVESGLGIEKAQMVQKIAGLTAQVKQAEVDAAEDNMQRRRIKAPFAGEVVKVFPNVGEWVQPGDPVIHLVEMDRLRIQSYLKVADYMPAEIKGRRVTVEVQLPHGRRETFQGKVDFVSPLVIGGTDREVRAEVANRKDGNQWLLHPGLEVDMTIHLK